MLRLAKALSNEGHNVSLFILLADRIDDGLKAHIAPNVPVAAPRIFAHMLWSKIDSALYRLGLDFSFLRLFYSRSLAAYVRSEKADVVHTHLFTSDIIGAAACRGMAATAVATIHGDYLMYDDRVKAGRPIGVLNFSAKLDAVLNRYDAIVVISEEQRDFFEKLLTERLSKIPVHKIYNGFAPALSKPTITRKCLGIPEDAFVVGMVGRGIREKGWHELIEAFRTASLPGAYLVLVGDGEFIRTLKDRVTDANIIFTGAVDNVLDYIRFFDVGCLPTFYHAESLPTVVIEYLFCSKPVVATPMGEIPRMIGQGTAKPCGQLVYAAEPVDLIQPLTEALVTLYSTPNLRRSLALNCASAAQNFGMTRCVRSYEAIYRGEVLAAPPQQVIGVAPEAIPCISLPITAPLQNHANVQ